MLGQCSALSVLKLANTDIGAEGARSLVGELGKCPSLVSVDLAFNDHSLGGEGIAMIEKRTNIPDKVVVWLIP